MNKKYYNGYQFTTLDNHIATIINYINSKHIIVKFDNGLEVNYTTARLSSIHKHRMPQVKSYDIDNQECYRLWSTLINRAVYHSNSHEIYKETSICDEWRVYDNFKKWYEENYYTLPSGESVQLDKDILVKHNTVYSPSTCIFVPQTINGLLTNRAKATIAKRICSKNTSPISSDMLPIGVTWCNDKKKYRASINYHGKVKNLGRFNTVEEAFNVYKIAKEQYIKDTANEYKQYIPNKLYEALINYKVEIND